jgi:hypothetical protein
MKNKDILMIIMMGMSLFFWGISFAQVTVTHLPEASISQPVVETEELDEEDDDLTEDNKNKLTGDPESVALILSNPLPSFRSNS